jgi:oxygen-dependent protoporphyrinogen oxidase
MTSRSGTRVAIVGGGIAGLSIGYAIRRQDPGASVVVLERNPETGGNIRTEVVDGYTCEWGPDGFLDNAPATLQLVKDLGLEDRLLPSSDAARRRFIWRGKRLHEVPTSPGAFVTTRLLSLAAKIRLLCEPLGPRPPEGDESIHDFAARRIGGEAASIMVGSMVSGIFAGDARALSLRACFPKMWELEHQYGSLVRALIATRRTRRREDAAGAPAGRLTSFRGGMAELVAALTSALGTMVRKGTPALSLQRASDGTWLIETATGIVEADAVVLSGPAAQSASLVRDLDPNMATDLDAIATAPLAVVCLGYEAAAAGPLNGFGFLVPRSEGVRILGALWETSIYADRAAPGKALLRVMIGGATDPGAVLLDDETLLAIVREDLKRTMGLAVAPEFVKIIRHRRGIPQYVRGHAERMERLEATTERHGSLVLAGNSYRGVSINSCIAEANGLAVRVLDAAKSRRDYRLAG